MRLYAWLGACALACGPSLIEGDPQAGDDDQDPPPGDPGGGGDDPGVCTEVTAEVRAIIPNVLLLVDRSQSMEKDFPGAPDRWAAVYRTLMDPTTGIVKRLEDDVRFGLALYTSYDGNSGGACPILDQVDPAMANHAAIDAVFRPADLGEDTPTGAAIFAVTPLLAGLPDEGPRVIILATDGLPDTCDDPDPDGQTAAKQASITAALNAYAQGIETTVISVGPEVAQDHLQDLANAGKGMAPGGATNAPYYQALDADALVAAFDAIIDGVRSCRCSLNGTVDPAAAPEGKVYLDDILIPQSDWQLVDPSTIELLGPSCNVWLEGGDHEISATFPCDGFEID